MHKLILVLAAMCCSVTARAQVFSIYGTFAPTHGSNVEAGCVKLAASSFSCTPVYTSFWVPSFGGGVTFNFFDFDFMQLGLDVRGSTKSGSNGVDTIQPSIRFGFRTPGKVKLKPFVQVGSGYMATRTANKSTTAGVPVGGVYSQSFVMFGAVGGLDYPIRKYLDIRVFDFGYYNALGSDTNFTGDFSHAKLVQINTGVVLHF